MRAEVRGGRVIGGLKKRPPDFQACRPIRWPSP